jgi:hypothetical protein
MRPFKPTHIAMFDVNLRGKPVPVSVMIVGTQGFAKNDYGRKVADRIVPTIERESDGTWNYKREQIPDPKPIE